MTSYQKITEIVTVEQRHNGWYIVDLKGLTCLYDDARRCEYGPFKTDEEAYVYRNSLYNELFNDH